MSIWTSYWKNAHLSALAGDALRASPADEPADEQGSIEGLRLYFTPFTRPNFSGHQSFRERPRRLAFYRARAARAQPWTGVTDASSSCASGGTMPRRQETAAQEPRGRSTNTTSESPRRAAPNRRNRAKTRTYNDAESHAGPVGGAAQRLGLENLKNLAVGGVFATHGIR